MHPAVGLWGIGFKKHPVKKSLSGFVKQEIGFLRFVGDSGNWLLSKVGLRLFYP
jgi:hypothetical protein